MQAVRERGQADAVQARDADEGERGSDATGELEFVRLPESHRTARVDQHMQGQLRLGTKQTHEQLPHPAVNVPVHVPQVVAGAVVPVVGELDAEAFSAAGSPAR